jgi:tRNA 2-thiouridine synthesizing protein E
MSFFHNGREILTDNEGFLKNKEDWSVELMEYMAKQDNLTLTLEHKLVIETVQHYYEEYATTPPIRGLITLLKKQGHPELNSIALAVLFPKGAAKTAARYAGLPKPAKCI